MLNLSALKVSGPQTENWERLEKERLRGEEKCVNDELMIKYAYNTCIYTDTQWLAVQATITDITNTDSYQPLTNS